MNAKKLAVLFAAPALLAMVVGAGCGGGSGSSALVQTAARGTVAMKVTIPAGLLSSVLPSRASHATRGTYSGAIPVGTLAVKVTVTDSTNATQTEIAIAPTTTLPNPTGTVGTPGITTLGTALTLNFASVPAGAITVTATCYPDVAAVQNPLAIGTLAGTVVALQTTRLTVPVALTIDHITVAPNPINLTDGAPATPLTATAFNAANQPVAFPLLFSTDQPAIAAVTGSSTPGQAFIQGYNATGGALTATLTVIEPNSGLQKVVPVTVQPGNNG